MLDPDLVRRVLAEALSTGGRFAELFAETRSSTSIRLDDGKIEEVVSGRDRGAGVRVFHRGAQAYAFSNRLEVDALLDSPASSPWGRPGSASRVEHSPGRSAR